MNKIMLIGRLTKEVETSSSTNSNNTAAVARYTLAVNRPYKQNGQQEADFIRCVAFGKTAELAEKYLGKGMKMAVEGRIQTGSYINRDGQKIYTTDVVVERQEFLEKRPDNSQSTPAPDTAEDYADRLLGAPSG